MIQEVRMTHEEKVEMYMQKCTKRQLVEMLINCNEVIKMLPLTYEWNDTKLETK